MSAIDRKSEGRDERLSVRKTHEEVLRKKMHAEAQQKCIEYSQKFGQCAQKNGMLVVFSCRNEINECKLLFKLVFLVYSCDFICFTNFAMCLLTSTSDMCNSEQLFG
jgi:hypothetical protein